MSYEGAEMIFPPRPKAIERDDTKHGVLYYTSDQLKWYGIKCVEEYKRCQQKPDTKQTDTPMSNAFDDLFSALGIKK